MQHDIIQHYDANGGSIIAVVRYLYYTVRGVEGLVDSLVGVFFVLMQGGVSLESPYTYLRAFNLQDKVLVVLWRGLFYHIARR